jgi:hypothetical protein
MRRPYLFPVLVFLMAAGSALPALAREFGSFSLQPGQTKQIRIGSTYRTIRLCNGAESAGTLDAIIGDHDTIHLAPGLCAEDSGDTIQLRNAANGPVSGIYRRQYDFFDGP